jgi:GNAT acetyltransferase-like protein
MSTARLHEFADAAGVALELSSFDDAQQRWEFLAERHPAASIYHSTRWLELLRRAYGFHLLVALIQSCSQTLAGCVFARSQNPFARRLIAMPFSDRCDPLAFDSRAQELLLTMLAADPRVRACEIRGIEGLAPWHTVSCFQDWEVDVSAPSSRLQPRLATNFRRNLVRAQRRAIRVERGRGLSLLSRFYLMHCESRRRQGMPVQPASFFCLVRDLFAPSSDFDIWIASEGNADLAAAVTLRDRDRVYYKWSARAAADSAGAGHFLVWSIVEAIATSAQFLNLGRADLRNHGLNRFKRELGAVAAPLPYSFVPHVPRRVSPEVLSGWHALAAGVWRRMPPRMCRTIGSLTYRYLS